jgi:transcriptional antiterminator RfaH
LKRDEKMEWYLLRAKAGEECRAQEQLTRIADDVLLPLVKLRVRRWGRMVKSVAPLFPCYLFSQLDLARDFSRLRYTRGLRELVCFGGEPAVVPEWIINGLKERCASGPVELPEPTFLPGDPVRIADGPLREFEGVFERYLSGQERIAILLSVMGGGRAVLPASMVVPVV